MKRIRMLMGIVMVSALIVLIPWADVCYAAGQDDASVQEQTITVVLEDETAYVKGEADNDELYEKYIESKLYPPVRKRASSGQGSKLTGVNKAIYDKLKEEITLVANGTNSSTIFKIAVEDMDLEKNSWTAEELGVEDIVVNGAFAPGVTEAIDAKVGIDLAAINHALLADCPYELYWYDKTVGVKMTGMRMTANYVNGQWLAGVSEGPDFKFAVAEAYAAGQYEVNTVNGTRVEHAIEKAADIVNDYSSDPDYEKLKSYKENICELVTYDHAAADDDSTPYGDSWQIISVFDEDNNTNVVCEGYSKAFQYLCELTNFTNDISCISVGGRMGGGTGAGEHMWNIINMEDGNNYLVDVTNCDYGTVGWPDHLFLVGYESGDVENGYVFFCNGTEMSYVYDEKTLRYYSSELVIHNENYVPFTVVDSGTLPGDLAWTINSQGGLTISGEGALEAPVDPDTGATLEFPWKAYADDIETIVIGDNVTEIAPDAFSNCPNLTDVEFPKTLKKFGHDCFANTPIETANMQDGMLVINDVLVAYEGTDETLVVPEGITDICQALYGNSSIKTVVLPESLTTLGYPDAFMTGRDGNGNLPLNAIVFKGDAPDSNAWTAVFNYNDSVAVYYLPDKSGWDSISAATPFCHLNDNNQPVVDHTPGEAAEENKVDSTCSKEGSYDEVISCTFCGKELSRTQKTIAKKAHTEVVLKAVDPTCTEKGKTEGKKCSVCGEILVAQTEIPELGHAFSDWTHVADSTCSEKGYDTRTCSRCRITETKYLDLLEHDWEDDYTEDAAATCTTDGSRSIHCRNCDAVMNSEVIAAFGHSFGEWVTVSEPTYDAAGRRERTCARCGATETEDIAKLERTSIAGAAVSDVVAKVYTGKEVTQAPVVVLGDTTLKEGEDYEVSYSNNKLVGTATVTVNGIGAYTGSVSETFVINPKPTTWKGLKGTRKGFTAKWAKRTIQTTGYQVQYSTSNKFPKGSKTKIKTVTKTKTLSKKVTGLKAKKKYYVRVRTYKVVNGTRYYSAWTKARPVRTK